MDWKSPLNLHSFYWDAKIPKLLLRLDQDHFFPLDWLFFISIVASSKDSISSGPSLILVIILSGLQ
ncbi:unnamed protein product, partial [Citrullus colocynthis]